MPHQRWTSKRKAETLEEILRAVWELGIPLPHALNARHITLAEFEHWFQAYNEGGQQALRNPFTLQLARRKALAATQAPLPPTPQNAEGDQG